MRPILSLALALLTAAALSGCSLQEQPSVSSQPASSDKTTASAVSEMTEVSSGSSVGGTSSQAEEGTLLYLQEQGKLENIVPVSDDMSYMLAQSDKKGGTQYPYDCDGLLYYWKDGKKGVADWNGTIRLPAEDGVEWCPAHGFYTMKSGVNYNADFSANAPEGHGLARWYYDAESQNLIFQAEGPASLIPPEKKADAVSKTGLPGILEVGRYEIPDASYPEEGAMKLLGAYVILDSKGNAVTDPSLTEATSFRDGICAVKQDGKWRFIDETGKQVLDQTFDGAYQFHEGVAAVCRDGKWGYIRLDGSSALEFQFEEARSVHDGTAWVKENGIWKQIEI